MSFVKVWCLVLAGAWAMAMPCASSAAPQKPDSEQAAKDAAVAKKAATEKRAAEQSAKLKAMQKSMEDLAAKRSAIAEKQGKDSDEFAAVSARLEKIKKQADQLRKNIKSGDAKESVARAKKAADAGAAKEAAAVAKKAAKAAVDKPAKVVRKSAQDDDDSEIRQLLKKHGIELGGDDVNVDVERGPNGEIIVRMNKDDGGQKLRKEVRIVEDIDQRRRDVDIEVRPRISAGHPEGPAKVQERRIIVRGDGPQHDGHGEPRHEMRIERRMDSDEMHRRHPDMHAQEHGPGGHGPGPMDMHRRLQVLEDRLSSIEHKLDALLAQLGSRGPRGDVRAERGPRPPGPSDRPDAAPRARPDNRPDQPPPPGDRPPRPERQRRPGASDQLPGPGPVPDAPNLPSGPRSIDPPTPPDRD